MTKNKIDPGEGYRLLDPNERVINGDEYFGTISKRWILSKLWKNGIKDPDLSYRRKIAQPSKPKTKPKIEIKLEVKVKPKPKIH